MSELSKLYTANKTSGSVWVTMKRVERPISTGRKKLKVDGPVCLVHASDGSRKIACVVPSGEHVRFHMDLFTVIKANTENLLKPKRAKRKINKAS